MFTGQNFKPLKKEDKTNLTFVVNWFVIYKMRYWNEHGDQIFSKSYGFLSFARNIDKNIGKNLNKNFIGKYSQKLIDHTKESVMNALKKSPKKRAVQKTAEATGNLIGDKTADTVQQQYNYRDFKNSTK